MGDDTGWEAQLAKLKKYRRKHGDCNVPRGWAEDPRLGTWVSNQRQGIRKRERSKQKVKFTGLTQTLGQL
jgi:hypothetical protein